MATYKVLQDIEAEDKLLGPLTLKQFIFAAITIGLGFVIFLVLGSPMPIFLKLPVVGVFMLPLLVFGFMAAPISRDQPNDIWLLARLRFLFKPRNRIWNQDGISQLVTITAPKREVQIFTNNLSQTEVKSRLQALANTLDSRGWAVKNVNTNLFAQPGYLNQTDDSDRLVNPSSLPQDVPTIDISAADDILDEQSNSTAQHLDQLVKESTAAHKQQAATQMLNDPQDQQTTSNYWFMNQPAAPSTSLPQDYATFNGQQLVSPGTNDQSDVQVTEEEKELAHHLTEEHQAQQSHIADHMKTLQPLHDREGNIIPPKPATQLPTLTPTKPKSLDLAFNDDLNVDVIARQVNKPKKDDDEVVVNLH